MSLDESGLLNAKMSNGPRNDGLIVRITMRVAVFLNKPTRSFDTPHATGCVSKVDHRRRKTRKPTFVELFAPPSAMQGEVFDRVRVVARNQGAHSVESCHIARLDELAAGRKS